MAKDEVVRKALGGFGKLGFKVLQENGALKVREESAD